MLLPAPRPRAIAAFDLRCQQLTEEAIAARLGVSEKSVRRYLTAMRRWYGVEDTASAAYLHGRTQGSRATRRRRVRDDEPTLPW